MRAIANLAGTYQNLGEHERALPLQKEAAEGRRLLLGSQQPDTLVYVGNLGNLLYKMGNHAAAVPLLQEAAEGLTALSVGGFVAINAALHVLRQIGADFCCCIPPRRLCAHIARTQRFWSVEYDTRSCTGNGLRAAAAHPLSLRR